MITQEYLKSILHYNPDTGLFTRNFPIRGVSSAKPAGTLTKAGYISIGIDKKHYLAHRLAVLYMTGKWPEDQVDHINENKSDNSWVNLREATRSQNFKNVGARKNNKLGVKGVTKTRNGFMVTIVIGTFYTLEEAKAAYEKAAILYHGEFIHKSVKAA